MTRTSYYEACRSKPVMNIRPEDRFAIAPTFVSQFVGKEPEWGPVGQITYKRTYARPLPDGSNEDYWQTLERIVNGIYTVQKWHCHHHNLPWSDSKAQRSAQTMFRLMWDFKFLPGGRGLWMMGTQYVEDRGSAALNNCFVGSEKLITFSGVATFAELEGQNPLVLTKEGWAEAQIKSFGVQKVQRVTFAPATRTPKGDSWRAMRSNLRHTITVTPNHRWLLTSGAETTALKVGDFVPAHFSRDAAYSAKSLPGASHPLYQWTVPHEPESYKKGFQHGLVFADGTAGYKYVDGGQRRYELRLCGDKNKHAAMFENVTHPESYNGDGYAHLISTTDLKRPPVAADLGYVRGFVEGWIAGDASEKPSGGWSLASQDADAVKWLIENAAFAGYMVTGLNTDSTVETNFGTRSAPCQRVSLTREETAWKVVNIEALEDEEPVYCAVVPSVGAFTLANGIYTGNCSFVSTQDIDKSFSEPFCFLMDFSMLGVGVGGDCKGAGKVIIQAPKRGDDTHVVEDTREGWVNLVARVLEAYVGKDTIPGSIDYSKIRPYGTPIKGFGGTAAGPEPLIRLVTELQRLLDRLVGFPITSEAIVDIFDMIGVCVVAGNVRRTAIIMFGEADDEGFLNLKNPAVNKDAMMSHRWASNNSIFARVGMNYSKSAGITQKAGEPGFMWLDNAKKFGRMGELVDDSRVGGFNPCAEISLESYELCVAGRTMIQFDSGVAPIDSLVGKEIKVWNGDGWSTVKPRVTGHNRELLRVTLSDGSFLDCTENHGWHIKPEGKRNFRRVEAKDLKSGDQVVDFNIDKPIIGRHEPNAFEWGLFAGNGYVDSHNEMPMVSICGATEKLRDLDVKGVWYKHQEKPGYAEPYNRLCLRGLITMQDAVELNQKSVGLPQSVFGMDRSSLLEFVAGWIETDGTITNKGSEAEGYRIYGSEPKMRDLQQALRRIGINHATIRLFADAGAETDFGKRNYALWYCQIPSFECGEIPTRLKRATYFGERLAANNAHSDGEPIDRAWKQKIVSVERLPDRQTTYCFDEPENHMAVFGNVLTYQCNLVELFPSKHASYEEFERTIKFAYLYAKTVSLIPTHNSRTNAVMLRNRRIGLSQSGIIQSFTRHGRRTHFEWCDKGYAYVTRLDKMYSEWLCVRPSIKKTTVKPAGTTSLLPGVTPGIHYEHAAYYYRTIRVAKNSPIVEKYKAAGYLVEDDIYDKGNGTVVIYFPIKAKFFDRAKHEVSMWEQLENAAQMQKYWSDNSVSITVTFKPEEAKDIVPALELYESRLKTVSFLPLEDHGYKQAPYITIDEAEYERAMAKIAAADLSAAGHDDASTPRFCDGDICTVLPRGKRVTTTP